MNKTVHIIGAGFSGLTLAWELRRRGLDVHIYDQSERTGGLICSTRTQTHLREAAANGVMWNPRLQNLADELGIEFSASLAESKKRFIFRGRLKRWPLNIKETAEFLEKILKFFFYVKIRKDHRMNPKPLESIAQWCRHHAFPAAHEYLIQPALQGIYAGNTEEMSATLIAKSLGGGSKGTRAPRQGMGALILELERQLLKKGVRFSMNSKMGKELPPRGEPLVIATSAWAAAEILKSRAPEISEKLFQVQALPLVSFTAVWKASQETLQGFGCLFPPREKFNSLGVLSNSFIFADRGPDYSETWILGGALKQNICRLSDQEILEMVMIDRKCLLGTDQKPDEIYIERYEKAIPHYNLSLEKLLEDLKLPENVFLTGNYLGRLGLAKIYDQNIALAERISRHV